MTGTLALVGGSEWQPGCRFDGDLLELAGRAPVAILPTAAAFEHPQRAVATAGQHFATFGGTVDPIMVLTHHDAHDPALVERVRAARFLYLSGGSPLHLRSALRNTPVWAAIKDAFSNGAVLAGSSAGAMALSDPMIDPRGGAFTVGLGLISAIAVYPHFQGFDHRFQRTLDLADKDHIIAAISEQTALLRHQNGDWEATGVGEVRVFRDQRELTLAELKGI